MATDLDAKLKLADIVALPNIAEKLSAEDLDTIGAWAMQGLELDINSRSKWEERNERVHALCLQVMEKKSYPWEGASNVKFPIITIAALQYHARAYPALVTPTGIVKYRVFGPDPEGKKNKQGARIADHMDYQLTEEDQNWEDEMDKALIVQSLGGVFKKCYFNSLLRHNTSEMVLPKDLVISYYAKSLDTAPRLSHLLWLSKNEVVERKRRKLFLDIELGDVGVQEPQQGDRLEVARDKASGMDKPAFDPLAPLAFVEQHRDLDLDGDGYAEPYAITVHRTSKKVVRIVARYSSKGIERADGKDKGPVIYIRPINYFQHYPFIPSPDGGIYGIGLGMLLGLNEAIDTLTNQLIDAGTLANLGGGFLGRGAKIRSGENKFKPGEWKNLDCSGEDIAKNVFPLPIKDPSSVLFQLLGLLIQYAERTGSATDPMVGVSPGQNTPAETSRNTLEQGMKVMSGVLKRTYRSFKQELRKLYTLNQLYLPEKPSGPFQITEADYAFDPQGIRPAADPSLMSDAQRQNQAMQLHSLSRAGPGFNLYEVDKRALEAFRIPDMDTVLPDPKGPNAIQAPPDAKLLEAQTKAKSAEAKHADAQVKHKLAAGKLLIAAQKAEAEISKLEADAQLVKATTQGELQGQKLAVISQQLEVSQAKHSALMEAIDTLGSIAQPESNDGSDAGGIPPMAGGRSNPGGNGTAPPSPRGV